MLQTKATFTLVLVSCIGFWWVCIQVCTLVSRTKIDWYQFIKRWQHTSVWCLPPLSMLPLHLFGPRAFLFWDSPIHILYIYIFLFLGVFMSSFVKALKKLGLCIWCCSWVVRVAHHHVFSNGTTCPTCRLKTSTISWWLVVALYIESWHEYLIPICISHTSWYEVVVYSCSFPRYPQKMWVVI